MSEHMFCTHTGHLTAKAEKIAKAHGAGHVNYTDPGTGNRRGWFSCPNRGNPFDQQTERAVREEIESAGGIAALQYAKDREVA